MNITIQFLFIESTNIIADERERKKRGHVINLYDSDLLCVPDGDFVKMIAPPSLNTPFAYLHVRDYPIDDMQVLSDYLRESIPDADGIPIRRAKRLVHVPSMSDGAISLLEATRELTSVWSDANAAMLRVLEVPDLSNAATDYLGLPVSAGDLPKNG
ncbi:MAG: hypothetical protein COA78_07050 [Blastopirellula sp.]|nr:MAG: hypothetical protein COA78_07050 [Blastopirellula sp.]